MTFKKTAFIAAIVAAAALEGCGAKGSGASISGTVGDVTDAETTAASKQETTADEQSAANTEGTQEGFSYMDKCEAMIEEIPSGDILEKRDGVTYPEFKKYTYYSQTAKRDTPVNVLLPADYTEEKEYPVLYILHGYYDNEDWMARDVVHISTMLANLVDDGKAKEMIVVCPYIYCSEDMPYCTGMDNQNTLNYDNFINDMVTDLMPYIEENFAVASGRENTAITGFSMGGRESLFIGVTENPRFGYVGAVCAAPGLVQGTGSPWQLKKDELTFGYEPPYLVLISAAQHDGVVGTNPSTYKSILEQNGDRCLWHSMSGTGHDASSVTPHLYNFMRMIFKEDSI